MTYKLVIDLEIRDELITSALALIHQRYHTFYCRQSVGTPVDALWVSGQVTESGTSAHPLERLSLIFGSLVLVDRSPCQVASYVDTGRSDVEDGDARSLIFISQLLGHDLCQEIKLGVTTIRAYCPLASASALATICRATSASRVRCDVPIENEQAVGMASGPVAAPEGQQRANDRKEPCRSPGILKLRIRRSWHQPASSIPDQMGLTSAE